MVLSYMRSQWLPCCIAVWLALPTAMVMAAMFPPNSPVVQLSQSSFKKEVLDIEKPTLVAFTAPWCGHCQRMAPEFHKAATNLDGIVKFANLDCDQDANKGICAQYQIQGFPTVKLFPSTKKRLPRDYRGERTAKALVDFAKDTLPLGARKLNGEELDGWVNEAPWRPKVILFSNKPKSSPLYRSLALDFRKTIDFAFMRGDEQLVRSSGRLVLGVDIPTEASLPVLMIVPARDVADDGVVAPLEKGNFKTYVGALKYRKIKAWLDEVAPKMGAGKKIGKAAKEKAAAAAKQGSAKGKVEAAAKVVNAKYEKMAEEILPEGAFVEWKAQKPFKKQVEEELAKKDAGKIEEDTPIMDESAPGENTWAGALLDIERAGEVADKLRAQAEEIGKKTRKMAELFNPVAKSDGAEGIDGEGLLDKAGRVYDDATQAAFDAVKDAQGAIADTTGKLMNALRGEKPFERKSEALMKQFSKWMAGEAPTEWEEQLGDQYAKAQKEAEALLKADPVEAAKQAWASEEWLLGQLRADKERMYAVMTTEQKAQVDNMIELIESRLQRKERVNPFDRDNDAQFPFGQEQVPPAASEVGSDASPQGQGVGSEKRAKAKHEEL